ncbi:hypothetical protein AB9K41_08810 [Cribrihabitans sp. XS_ASV171]
MQGKINLIIASSAFDPLSEALAIVKQSIGGQSGRPLELRQRE